MLLWFFTMVKYPLKSYQNLIEKTISEMELLQVYQNDLEEILQENSDSCFKMEFSIKKSDKGNLLSVVSNSSVGELELNISISDNLSKSCKLPVHHIKRMYDYFDRLERLNEMRSLMRLMRIWR